MTDEPGMTYEALLAEHDQAKRELARAREERHEARAERDEATKNGRAWKELADERADLIKNLHKENKGLTIEAAELRGYIRRVNELDPKRARRNQANVTGKPMALRDIERMMR